MKISQIISVVTFLALTSCKKDEKPTYIEGMDSNASNTVQNAKNSATNMLLPNNTVTGQTGTVSNVQQLTPQQVQQMQQQQNAQTVAPGMNPPHGQPNHRCDIPVGAPLNSAPSNKAATQKISVNPQTATTQTTKQKTAPGMNPPHGEPGHRCDIAVGAPLNSPPGKTATQTITPTSAPAKPLPSTVAAPVTQGVDANGNALAVNPAHGEPGHRCDIAVGAPLK